MDIYRSAAISVGQGYGFRNVLPMTQSQLTFLSSELPFSIPGNRTHIGDGSAMHKLEADHRGQKVDVYA